MNNLKNKIINFIKFLKGYFTSIECSFLLIFFFVFYLLGDAGLFIFAIMFSYIFAVVVMDKKSYSITSVIISTILLFAFGYTYNSEFTKYSNIRKVNKIKTYKDEFYAETCNKECRIYEYVKIPKCKSYVIVDKNYNTTFLGRYIKDKSRNKIICEK